MKKNEMKLRNFRASEKLWNKLKKEAEKQEKSVSQLIRDFCNKYLEK